MPDFEVEMTHTDTATRKAWRKSVNVMDAPREQAIPLGITELFKWCADEARTNPDSVPISPKAYDYWEISRNTGGLMYEILSGLEAFGLTFGIKPLEAEAPPHPRNGKTQRNGTAPKAAQRLDLRGMLGQQLEYLQARQKEVAAERKTLQAEFEENQASINQITQFMLLSQPVKKRGKAKAHAERAEQN